MPRSHPRIHCSTTCRIAQFVTSMALDTSSPTAHAMNGAGSVSATPGISTHAPRSKCPTHPNQPSCGTTRQNPAFQLLTTLSGQPIGTTKGHLISSQGQRTVGYMCHYSWRPPVGQWANDESAAGRWAELVAALQAAGPIPWHQLHHVHHPNTCGPPHTSWTGSPSKVASCRQRTAAWGTSASTMGSWPILVGQRLRAGDSTGDTSSSILGSPARFHCRIPSSKSGPPHGQATRTNSAATPAIATHHSFGET